MRSLACLRRLRVPTVRAARVKISARRATAGFLLLVFGSPAGWTAGETRASAGESIYMRGVLASGASLEGSRQGASFTKGAQAACVSCHRRSGLGTTEGRIVIPPIAGRYLFHARKTDFDEVDLPYIESERSNRDPYTDATLARAIREGLDSEGKPLGYLMPRFALGDADMAALLDYLKKLETRRAPGVTDTLLHFATIITPDADPVKRRGMLDVMQRYFADKNVFPFGKSPAMRSTGKTVYSKSMYMVKRQWQLHVWELTGPAATWTNQLHRHLAEEPVLAAVSGLGGSNWAPVDEFCEREHLPCLFPNVEVPVVANRDFYTLYFSQGVLLEAQLIAQRIGEAGAPHIGAAGKGAPVKIVQQIYRAGDSGEPAALALAAELKTRGIAVHDLVLANGSAVQPLAEALRGASSADALVLWLRPGDIAALGDAAPSRPTVYMSGLMGGLERSPLPAGWRSRTRLAYPFDLPDQSRVRVHYPLGWFSMRHIPVVAEQVQVDTYLACGLLAETLSHMADAFVRDYLVERTEEMLEHRVLTGPYPHLTLAEGQRFASKGGYLVPFAGDGTRLIADGAWTVPE